MSYVGQAVIFKSGTKLEKMGTITSLTEDRVFVDILERPLPFPDAFANTLKFRDPDLQSEIVSRIAAAKADAAERSRQEREARQHAKEAAQRAEAERIAAERRRSAPVADRHPDENNLAFKCNFCDGGNSGSCLGYKAVCSHDRIEQNIKDGRAWCSKSSSPCYRYIKHEISRQELDALNAAGTFVCYESRMLIDWKAEAGEDVDDDGIHRARRITNASTNSLAVLTTVMPGDNGKDRVIFGVFITGTVDEGDDVKAGYVKAKPGYRIELTPDEAKQMKFWHYYKNPNKEESTQWGTGLYRYMKDSACVRILKKIVDIKTDPQEKDHAQNVLDYYCELKGLDTPVSDA